MHFNGQPSQPKWNSTRDSEHSPFALHFHHCSTFLKTISERRTRFATASLERKLRKVKNCLPGVPMKCEFRARVGGGALKAACKLDLSARSDGAISCWKQRTERRSTTIFQRQRKA